MKDKDRHLIGDQLRTVRTSRKHENCTRMCARPVPGLLGANYGVLVPTVTPQAQGSRAFLGKRLKYMHESKLCSVWLYGGLGT